MTLRRLFRRFLPRRKHPLLDAEVTSAPRDNEFRERYAAAVTEETDIFVTQRFEEGLRWREVARQLAPHGVPARVLDVGGGNGAIELAFSGQPSSFVVSVDALWNITAASLRVKRVVADAAALPFRAEAFDLVLCLETIEHVPDPRAVAGEIARVAAADAVVLVTTPARWRYFLRPDPHFGIRGLTMLPPSLQRRVAARRGFDQQHHFVNRIYGSVGQLRGVFRELALAATLARSRAPGRWFWDAVVFRKR